VAVARNAGDEHKARHYGAPEWVQLFRNVFGLHSARSELHCEVS